MNRLTPEDPRWQSRVSRMVSYFLRNSAPMAIQAKVAKLTADSYSTASVYRMFENAYLRLGIGTGQTLQPWAEPVVAAFFSVIGIHEDSIRLFYDPERDTFDSDHDLRGAIVTPCPRRFRRFFLGQMKPEMERVGIVKTFTNLIPPELLTPRIAREFFRNPVWKDSMSEEGVMSGYTQFYNGRRKHLRSSKSVQHEYLIHEPTVTSVVRREGSFQNLTLQAIKAWFKFISELVEAGNVSIRMIDFDLDPEIIEIIDFDTYWMSTRIGDNFHIQWMPQMRGLHWRVPLPSAGSLGNRSPSTFEELAELATHRLGPDSFLDRLDHLMHEEECRTENRSRIESSASPDLGEKSDQTTKH